MKILSAFLIVLALAAPAAAQSEDPPYAVRVFGLGASQSFAAKNTFDAVFGNHNGKFWGGGIEVALQSGIFVDAEISKFSHDGQRAFISGGQTFELGIPLTASITPIDVMAGYRKRIGRTPVSPYAEIGATSYHYKETSSFSDPSENVDKSKVGFIFAVGAEVRLARMLAISADLEKARVTGIIGTAGISQQLGENDLGGLAGRVRIILGR